MQTKEKRRETALASGIGQRPDLGHADKGQIKDKEGADVPADDQLQWGVQTKEKETESFRQRKRGGKVKGKRRETALASGIGQRPDLGHADKGQRSDRCPSSRGRTNELG